MFPVYDLTMPHAVPPKPISRPLNILKHNEMPTVASLLGFDNSPFRRHRNQALEAWSRVAFPHAVNGTDTRSASDYSISDSESTSSRGRASAPPQNNIAAASGWYTTDHRPHVLAAAQRALGATHAWVPTAAPARLTRAALSPLDTTAHGNDHYMPSPDSGVISVCSTDFSDIDQRESSVSMQDADDERYTHVSPESNWASDSDQVSDIEYDDLSPALPSPVYESLARPEISSPGSSLQLLLTSEDASAYQENDAPHLHDQDSYTPPPVSSQYTVNTVSEDYVPEPVSDGYTQFVIEAPSNAPVVTPEYRKTADHLADWIAEWLWRVVGSHTFDAAYAVRSNTIGSRRKDQGVVPAYLAENIRSILLSTLLQPSTVFLALWYIKRLPVYAGTFEPCAQHDKLECVEKFRKVLFGEGDYAVGSSEKRTLELYAPFKLFVNGVLLASKMLDDATFSNKVWHEISQIAIRDINALELSSLALLDHDLTVPPNVWVNWLGTLRRAHLACTPFPAPIGPARETPHGALLLLFNTLIAANSSHRGADDGPVFLGIEERIAQRLNAIRMADIDEMDEDGPIRDEYRLSRRSSGAAATRPPPPANLPPPAEWFPAADPIVPRQQPQAYNAWPPTTAYAPFSFDVAPVRSQYDVSPYYYWTAANVGYSYPVPANTGYPAYVSNFGGYSTGYPRATCCT